MISLLYLFISCNGSICSAMDFPLLGKPDHVVVSVSPDFSPYTQWEALFHCIAYGHFCADWDGLCDYLRDVLWRISLNSVLLLMLVKFVSGFRFELIYMSLIKNISSSPTHLHGF